MLVFPSCYNPPAVYFLDIINADRKLVIDLAEHFTKQTLRNRCHILGPNGSLTLVVPVVHNDRTHTAMSDIMIAEDDHWQRQHWRSLCTAYNSSPFFEFYRDEFEVIYASRNIGSLTDLNRDLTLLILKLIGLDVEVSATEQWIPPVSDSDPRVKYSTGEPVKGLDPYPQVFSYKYGYTDGLSILDLLFNKGPETLSHLNSHGDDG